MEQLKTTYLKCLTEAAGEITYPGRCGYSNEIYCTSEWVSVFMYLHFTYLTHNLYIPKLSQFRYIFHMV